MLCRSGPGAPSFARHSPQTPSPGSRPLATSSIVIAGRSPSRRAPRLRHRARRRHGIGPVSAPAVAPLRAVGCPEETVSSCLACSLAVVAFPPRDSRPRLGPPFGGLPVLRDHPTPLVPSPSRPFVLGDYRRRPTRRGGREVSPGKNAELRADPVATTHRLRRISGFTAGSRLTHGRHALRRFAFARFGTAPMTSTRRPLAGLPPSLPPRPCLFGAGFPPSGSPEDFHLLFRAHAGRRGGSGSAGTGRALRDGAPRGDSTWARPTDGRPGPPSASRSGRRGSGRARRRRGA